MAQMKCGNVPLASLNIPQDVIDAAEQVKMDAETLVKLCVQHSVDAARDFLSWAASKLPGGQP
jgi:hypothetical protein